MTMMSVLFFEFARTLPARAQRRTPMRREAQHKFRFQLVAAAAWTGLLASVIACGSEAPDEKVGGGLDTSKGGAGGSINTGKGGSVVGVGVGGSNGTAGKGGVSVGGSMGTSGASSVSGSGGLDSGSACAVTSAQGDKEEVALLFMIDISGSMRCPIPERMDPVCTSDPNMEYDNTRWKVMRPALESFFSSAESGGMWAGISFFSRKGGSCTASDYEKPDAEIALLPGASSAISNAIEDQSPGGATPTVASLTGALTHAESWAGSHATQQVVVVYATDGYPLGCSNNDKDNTIDLAAAVAKKSFDGANHIRTYVLGIGPNLSELDKIAASGGTDKALLVDPTKDLTTELGSKLGEIRSAVAVDCVYNVPNPPAGQNFDGRVNVKYTGSDGKMTQIGFNDAANCTEGWQYTDLTKQQIELCGTTCDSVTSDSMKPGTKPRVDVEYGCSTVKVGDVR